MQVKKINISGFRNIDNIEILPDNQMNVIFGENAQGKTNILEALWLFTGAKSFRGSKEQNFIGFNKENAKNSLLFKALGVENEAQMCFGEKREAFLNGKKLSSPSSLAGSFNAVVFCPDDLSLVRDGP
ncbi:MAG: AAA family ATPase, partial [Acutalibacteraceae bacterium]|nr:AAA family ATPase [Acutalibacteraceae bacterium]